MATLRQMPKDTILFVSDDKSRYGIGYSYDYFKGNLVAPSSDYQKIYYKAGTSRDTWIDYKKTIQLKPGNKEEMIAAALADKDFLVDFRKIPASYVYYKGEGEESGSEVTYRSYYSPYDGYYNHEMWLRRVDSDLNYETINRDKVQPDTDLEHHIIYYWDADDLHVIFPESSSGITNAIISINMLFLEYVEVNDKHIVYRNIRPNTAKYFGWDSVTYDTISMYDIMINVYKWEGLKKERCISPNRIYENNNLFIMPQEMEHNAFIFWNGVMYTYTVSQENSTYIRINGIDADTFSPSKLNEIKVYPMTSETENMETQIYVHCGVNNRYKNSVDFLLPVADSLIVYNGVDHTYAVEDDNAISYPTSAFSIKGDVTYLSEVLSINFTKV